MDRKDLLKNPDLADLAKLNLSDAVLEEVVQARIEARGIINSLDPQHIISWIDLQSKLKEATDKCQLVKATFDRHKK